MSSTTGRLPNTLGKEADSTRYNGGTIFVDHYSGCTHVGNQVLLATGETLTTKHKFKHFAHLHGVTIKGYRVDDHPFASAKFRADLDLQDQKVKYSGVGAHHQLGVAKRSGKTIASWARSLMMHQLEHWPEAFDEALWPFAFEPQSTSGTTYPAIVLVSPHLSSSLG